MALRTSQPVTEILRGWTVARGIPAGNDGADRIIRHLMPAREPIPIAPPVVDDPLLRAIRTQPRDEGQPGNCWLEQAILQGAVGRILDEFGGLQAVLKRSIALKKQSCPQGRRRLIHSGTTWKTERLSEALFR